MSATARILRSISAKLVGGDRQAAHTTSRNKEARGRANGHRVLAPRSARYPPMLLAAASSSSLTYDEGFLEKMRHVEGVLRRESGLMYRVLRAGGGGAHPLEDSLLRAHLEGRTARAHNAKPRGPPFESTYTGATAAPRKLKPRSAVPAGLGEALRLMVAGDKWRVYLPPALGFGDEGSERRDIGPAQALVYTLELVSIEGATTAAAARRGEAAHATLEGKADYFEWEDTTEPPWVLGLFRRPLYAGALHEGFQAAAARFGPSGEASFALSAESRYDAKAGKFIPSAVERMLELSAPGVFVRHREGMPWTKCRTERDRGASAAEVQSALEGCVTVARWRHDEL